MQDEQIAAGGLEGATLEGLLKEFLRWGQIVKEGAPGADFCFARALDYNVEVAFEGGEERENAWEDGTFRRRGWGHVNFFVEHVVKEDFEGVGEILQVLVLLSEVEGCERLSTD